MIPLTLFCWQGNVCVGVCVCMCLYMYLENERNYFYENFLNQYLQGYFFCSRLIFNTKNDK